MSWLPRRPNHTDRRCSTSVASSSRSRACARVAAFTAPALTPAITSNHSPRSAMRCWQAPTCQLPFAPPPDSTSALRIAPRAQALFGGELGHALLAEGGDALAGGRAPEQLPLQPALERLAGRERRPRARLH